MVFSIRTEGGLDHLRTDVGGDIRLPVRSRKRSKLEISGTRHWIRADEIYNFNTGHSQVR